MKAKFYYFLLMVIVSTSLFCQNTYDVKQISEVYSYLGYRNFEMNANGNVIYIGTDKDEISQIYLLKEGKIVQISSITSPNEHISGYVHINALNQIIWIQKESNPENTKNNSKLMFADENRNIKQINKNITEWGNECVYPSINDKGEIAWIQWGEGRESDYIYLYSGGKIIEVYSGKKTINFTSINNNGYIVYESQNLPEMDWTLRVFVWNGKEHQSLNAPVTEDPFSSQRPVIDNQNNVTYFRSYQNVSGEYYVMHSLNDGLKYEINKPISSGESLSHFSTMWIWNSNLIFIGADNQVYLFDKKNLTQLTNKYTNRSPFIYNDYMGWIFDEDESIVGKIEIRKGVNSTIIKSNNAFTGLAISKDAKVLFAGLGITTLPLFMAEPASTGIERVDMKDSDIKIFPNPVNDYIELIFGKEINPINIKDLNIYDLLGKRLYKKEITFDAFNRINVKELKEGIYFISINYDGKVITKKFILKK